MRLLFELDTKDYASCTDRFVRNSARSIIIDRGKVAVIHSAEDGHCEFPGGGIEAGESPIDAMIRETREEAGLTVLPASVVAYGYVHRIQKSVYNETEIFIQDNFYYLCQVQNSMDDGKAQEGYTLEYVDPQTAIMKNRSVPLNPYNKMMLERETRVLEMLIHEGLFD